jgi:hypothetical protein
MRSSCTFTILGLLATSALLSPGAKPNLHRVGRDMLCITEGAIEELPGQRLSVDVPKMRAYVNRWTSQIIAAQFTYLGPTRTESKLGSGQTRVQFGFKLRAQDPCNLVYAMWRIEPESKLVVSIKANPGQATSAQCGNQGYRNIKSLHHSPLPTLRPGDKHMFRVEMSGEQVSVFVDGALVWDGKVGREALRLDGPVGIRSDNAKLQFELLRGEFSRGHPNSAIPCKAEASE